MENIKILREKTGAGIVECKIALEESGNDIDKAVEILRKKGITKASKRGEREACEGLIMVGTDENNKKGYILEVNSETDFVARNDKFQAFSRKVFELIKENNPTDLNALLNLPAGQGTVLDNLNNLSGTIGEKLEIKRFDITRGETTAGYSHMNGRLGVLVALNKENENELAHNIAMQIAAANPRFIKKEDIPDEEIQKEKEIYKEQLLKEGKPENIMEKIIEGKMQKYYEEVCLVEQEYIKDDKKKIKDILGDIKVEKFVRYSL